MRKNSFLVNSIISYFPVKWEVFLLIFFKRQSWVQGNPRVYKALRNELAVVLAELQRIEAGGSVNEELLDTIELIAVILGGLKGEDGNGK